MGRSQNQALLTHDYSAARSPCTDGNQGDRGCRTRRGKGDQLLVQLPQISQSVHQRGILYFPGSGRGSKTGQKQARNRNG